MAARNEESARDRARRRARERQRQVIRRRRLLAVIGGLILVLLVVLATAAFGGDSKTKKAEDQLKPLTAPPDSAAAAHGRGIRAIDNVLSYTPYVSRGTPNQKLVALTFDDGPAPDTPAFIRVLRQNHAPATFFVITEQLKDFGDATREAPWSWCDTLTTPSWALSIRPMPNGSWRNYASGWRNSTWNCTRIKPG